MVQQRTTSFERYCSLSSSFLARFGPETASLEGEGTQTQEEPSAMFMVWNLIADLVETSDQRETEQQQITDFFPKLARHFHA